MDDGADLTKAHAPMRKHIKHSLKSARGRLTSDAFARNLVSHPSALKLSTNFT